MTPYYQDSACTIYHGDCREILPQLPKVDLVISDPPYGVRRPSARRLEHHRFSEVHGNDSVDTAFISLLNVVDRGAVYLFTAWDVLNEWRLALDPSFKVRSCIVWDKCVHGLADLKTCWAPKHEMILFAANGRHELRGGRPTDVVSIMRVSPIDLLHPYEKPESLIGLLVCHSSDEGNTVLDPFMGSGTTLRAAKDLGRKAIGIEIEERYCEIAAKRLAQEVLPLA